MINRFFLTAITAILIAPAANAADDGGFGSQRFSNREPSALSGDATSTFANDNINPAEIEPAAGNDDAAPDDQPSPAEAQETEDQPAAE